MQAAEQKTVIVGLGKTGLSCARYLHRNGQPFSVVDSRSSPPGVAQLTEEQPGVQMHLGAFDELCFEHASQLIVSPGVSIKTPAIVAAQADGAEIIGDIELFARHVNCPVVAVTGSNGKSTVTALLGEMAIAAGLNAKVGGNIGVPALDLLESPDTGKVVDVYVLELSSFQLETTQSLNAVAAVVLNLSADHMDRYVDLSDYAAAKQRIYRGDGVMVVNADDAAVMAMMQSIREKQPQRQFRCFSLNTPSQSPQQHHYGILEQDGEFYLARGKERLLPVSRMRMQGKHNWANALAALALGEVMGLSMAVMLEQLTQFAGLPHRTQWVREINGVNFYNDSKGTNVGATISAIMGMSGGKVLIAGGQGKGADFSSLKDVVRQNEVNAVVLLGCDAPLIEAALSGVVPVRHAGSMEQAVALAYAEARPGDTVLLSPACASFDMFNGFEDRGNAFVTAVETLS